MKQRLIIVSAPSGAGKSTLCNRILQEKPELVDCITCTTRKPRPGESDGNPYFFIDEKEFLKRREEGFFAEWAIVHNNYYGTPINQLNDAWSNNRFVIMDVDVKGAQTLKSKFPDAKTIFILPPSLEELERRLLGRDSGQTNDISLRLRNAKLELEKANSFDYRVVNKELDSCYIEFKKIIEELLRND